MQRSLAEQRAEAVGGERDAWREQCEELTQTLECTQEALKEVTAEREALAGDVEDYEAKVRTPLQLRREAVLTGPWHRRRGRHLGRSCGTWGGVPLHAGCMKEASVVRSACLLLRGRCTLCVCMCSWCVDVRCCRYRIMCIEADAVCSERIYEYQQKAGRW